MTGTNGTARRSLTLALEAVGKLWGKGFAELKSSAVMAALSAHHEIEQTPVGRNKTVPFYRHFLPFRSGMVALLVDNYRRYFKLALAHPRQAGRDPDKWAWGQLQPAVGATLEWIHDWYILACDGENQYVRRTGAIPFVARKTVSSSIPLTASPFLLAESWRAPARLFKVSLAHFGVGRIKQENMPASNSDEKLSVAHTRLLLKGARRVFLWELGAKIETVRNEETAAAGAIRVEAVNERRHGPNKRRGWQQRVKLYGAIQKALSHNPSLTGLEFCAELDKRHAPPLWDWMERGEWPRGLTWKEAWRQPGLCRKIRRVRQEAMKHR